MTIWTAALLLWEISTFFLKYCTSDNDCDQTTLLCDVALQTHDCQITKRKWFIIEWVIECFMCTRDNLSQK